MSGCNSRGEQQGLRISPMRISPQATSFPSTTSRCARLRTWRFGVQIPGEVSRARLGERLIGRVAQSVQSAALSRRRSRVRAPVTVEGAAFSCLRPRAGNRPDSASGVRLPRGRSANARGIPWFKSRLGRIVSEWCKGSTLPFAGRGPHRSSLYLWSRSWLGGERADAAVLNTAAHRA